MIFLFCLLALASAEEEYLADMRLEDLMDMKVSVASQQSEKTLDAPSVVTLMTSVDIQQLGARDLLEVLQFVPGFAFGQDTQGAVGLGFRGIWGQEGKILLLIDGIPANENLYSSSQLGNHYPASLIDRIEIIRGPGSARYGGNAELAVILVITRGAQTGEGFWSSMQASAMPSSPSRQDMSLGGAKLFGRTRVASNFFMGKGQRTDRSYVDNRGVAGSLRNVSNLDPLFFTLSAAKPDAWDMRIQVNNYRMKDQTGYGALLVQPMDVDFLSSAWFGRGFVSMSSRWKLETRLLIKIDTPWRMTNPLSYQTPGLYYDRTNTRYQAGMRSFYDISDDSHVMLGVEGFQDDAVVNSGPLFNNNSNRMQLTDVALFGEYDTRFSFGALTAGVRFERQTASGSALVPRFAYTKDFDPVYLKLLYSRAFRVPGIENINAASDGIKPEMTSSGEVEVGHRINTSFGALYSAVNIFSRYF